MNALRISPSLTLPVDVLTEAIGIVATRGAGKSYTSAVLIEEAGSAHIPFVVIDPAGVYHGLRSNVAGDGPGLPVYVLGGVHGDVPLEPTAGKLLADVVVSSSQSFVLDLSDLNKTQARTFVADFLDRLYDLKARDRSTLLLVIDESDEFAPQLQRSRGGDAPRCLGAVETVTKRGRSRGIGVVLITQRTQALNKDVLDLIETLIAMRQLAKRSRDAVEGWIADKDLRDEAGVIESLQSLPTGTAWVWSPLRGILEKIPVRRIKTFDSYATPKPGERRVEPSARREVDLDALGEQMRATVERAVANDPSALKRRVAELERQLAARPTEVETWVETVTERVEVPVFNGEVDRLEEVVRQLVQSSESVTTAAAAISDAVSHAKRKEPSHVSHAVAAPPVAPRAARPPASARREPQRTPSPFERGDGISAPQQRILDALAWFEAIGVETPRRPPLAAVAGVSSRSSGFRANVSTLSGRGLIAYPDSGRVMLTDAGREIAVPPEIAPTTEALHAAIYRMVSSPQATLLSVLIEAYPEAVDRETLAARAGVSSASSGFRANVSTLSGFELIRYPSPGFVAADPILFPGEQ